jgi:molybdopterin converting factor small subunit
VGRSGLSVRVLIPTPLRSYTGDEKVVEADGRTVDELLHDLDRRYPGLRFRVVDEQNRLRTHMKVFVGQESVRDLGTAVDGHEEITLMQALSGG